MLFRSDVGTANHSGAGMYNRSASSTLIDCTFTDNASAGGGGGIYIASGSMTLVRCTFIGNTVRAGDGGGVYNSGGSMTLTQCAFIANSASSGGGMRNASSLPVTLNDCTFAWNVTTNTTSPGGSGGGMLNATGSPILTNCTFINNSAMDNGGGMRNESGKIGRAHV